MKWGGKKNVAECDCDEVLEEVVVVEGECDCDEEAAAVKGSPPFAA